MLSGSATARTTPTVSSTPSGPLHSLRVPDGREILVEEPAGFSLHLWDKGELTTHVCVAPAFPSAVQYEYPFLKA